MTTVQVFDFRREPSGSSYVTLVDTARAHCAFFVFWVDVRQDPSPACVRLLRALADHVVDEGPVVPEYDELVSGRGQRYCLKLDAESAKFLTAAATRPSDWQQPDLPEDLWFLRNDGTPWFCSIAHEYESYLVLKAHEQQSVFDSFVKYGPFVERRTAAHLRLSPNAHIPERIFHVVRDSEEFKSYRRAAQSLGFLAIDVDVSRAVDEADVFVCFSRAFNFPEADCRDWESLRSYLRDLSWIPGKWYATFITGTPEVATHSPDVFWAMISALADVAHLWWESRVPFQAFLAGDGRLAEFDYNWLADQICVHDGGLKPV